MGGIRNHKCPARRRPAHDNKDNNSSSGGATVDAVNSDEEPSSAVAGYVKSSPENDLQATQTSGRAPLWARAVA